MTLILTTPTNPGTAAWTDAADLGVGAYINTATQTEPSTGAFPILFPQVGVTIPANTLQDGFALDIGCCFEVDTTAGVQGMSDILWGFAIQGQSTWFVGSNAPFSLASGFVWAGGYNNFSAVLNGSALEISGQLYIAQATTLFPNAQTPLLRAVLPVNYAAPVTIIPSARDTSPNPDPAVTLTARNLTVQILRP